MSSSMRTIRSMLPLFLGMSLLFIGNGLVIASCGVELKKMGVDEMQIGLVNTCFFVGALMSTISSHRIISKTGHIRAFAIFTAVFGVSAMFHSLSQNLYFWAFLRACLGYCYYGLLMVIESWLNAKTANFIRSRVLAFYEGVFYTSFGAGILILALDLSSFEIFIISAAFIMISSIPLNLIRIKQPQIPQKQSINIPKILGIVPLALVGALVAGIAVNGFFSMASLFVLLQGYGTKEVSFFMTIAMAGGFSVQLVIGGFSDKFGRRPAIIASSCVALVSALLFLLNEHNLTVQYILAFFFGSGIFCIYGLSIARANDEITDKTQSVQVARALLFSYSLASLASPMLMGVSMRYFGAFGFIYVYLIVFSFLIVFALTQKTVPSYLRKNYNEQHVARTSAISSLNVKQNLADVEK
ncbi:MULTISPECIES: MFS transporter [Campylobacter]|uniref:MFS transporter n=1 Tax=Campylobacter TaxID=194 RepID=UPI00147029F5|nr:MULTISPECIES: MFS transporter [Campylobacter]MBN7287629.1 MFS transporter [Campylobacter curvus]MDU6826500.1 MFS transporter [Campylobacter sp.]